jgi:hypothetical protein
VWSAKEQNPPREVLGSYTGNLKRRGWSCNVVSIESRNRYRFAFAIGVQLLDTNFFREDERRG